MFKLLIIEDSIAIKKELSNYLTQFYEINFVDDFTQTFKIIEECKPDLVLLDLNLPVFDGHTILDYIRKNSNIPVIVVTSKNNTSDELLAMKLGADDYVTKPYHLQILQTRIENLLRRCYQATNQVKLDEFTLDINKNLLIYQTINIELTNTECKILFYLFTHKNTIVQKKYLMQYLWDSELFIDENALAVNISRIRKKLPIELIKTIRNVGYSIYEK